MNLNKVQIIGRLGSKPEMRTFPNGGATANVNIATTEKWRDRESGETKERTEWIPLVFNGRLANLVGENLDKGSLVYVEGRLRTRKWKDRDTGLERSKTEVDVTDIQFGPAQRQGGQSPHGSSQGTARGGAAKQDSSFFEGDPNLDDSAIF